MNSTAEEAPAISVQGLNKSFGGAPVLHNLDLQVAWGEFLVLFGANGSGKTTLVRTLATLARPDSGKIHIAGRELRRDAAAIRGYIGVVTHQPLLYDDLTGSENLRFYGRMFRVDELEARIDRVAGQMGLQGHLHKRVRTLSHGMQKRLSLARAILHDPPILLLDEPETGLDQEALGFLDGLLTGEGGNRRTVLMTTHNLDRGLSLGDRVAVLAKGRIAYQESRRTLDEAGFRGAFADYLGVSR